MNQKTANITLAQHAAIHTQIAAVRVALEGAEQYASKAIGRHRTSDILRIAQTKEGRQAIAGALYQVYKLGNWLGEGKPVTMDTVFKGERPDFEDGVKTSLPWCTRNGRPN